MLLTSGRLASLLPVQGKTRRLAGNTPIQLTSSTRGLARPSQCLPMSIHGSSHQGTTLDPATMNPLRLGLLQEWSCRALTLPAYSMSLAIQLLLFGGSQVLT